MKQKEFYYKFEHPTYDEFIFNLESLKKKYSQQILIYKFINDEILQRYDTEKQVKIMKEYKRLIIKIILDVLKLFPQLEKIPHTTFMHGSFAKTINRFESDIDLNILYSNIYKDMVLPIEELISVALTEIVGFAGRDKVHTMMIYTPIKNFEDPNIYNTTNCSIIFPNGQKLNYSCRPNFDKVMVKIVNSSRDFSDFAEYIGNHSQTDECEEWCYSFDEIQKNCNNLDVNKVIEINDRKVASSNHFISDYNQLIESLLVEISNYSFEFTNYTPMSEINLNLKVANLGYVYRSLALIRRFLVYNGMKFKNLDFFEICNAPYLLDVVGNKDVNNYQNNILRYLWQISRIEKMFKSSGYNFSSRSNDILSIDELIHLYFQEYNNNNFINTEREITQNMHDSISKCLSKIKI